MFKEIGTLAEIGAKVGDVVECVDGCDGPNTATLSERDMHTFARFDYRIISRAERSPVRTVTRKVIVPGVYGRLDIDYWVHQKCVYIGIVDTEKGKASNWHRMTRDDLIAARDVFNQLIDALEE